MRKQLKWQITGFFSFCIILLMLAVLVFINKFSDYFYLNYTSRMLESLFKTTDDLFKVAPSDDPNLIKKDPRAKKIYNQLIKKCEDNNISICVIVPDNYSVVISIENSSNILKRRLYNYMIGGYDINTRAIKKGDYYIIQRAVDPVSNTEYMEIIGSIYNGYVCLIRTSIDSIKTNARIANDFISINLLLLLPLSLLLSLLISMKITKPISELQKISDRMIMLDFDVEFKVKGNNELSRLGNNINILAHRLQDVISELRRANLKLKSHIEEIENEDRKKNEFISDISHELKTPLALISGYAEGLVEGVADDPSSRNFYSEIILDETKKMNEIVHQLINLSRIEERYKTIVYKQFNIEDLIKDILRSHEYILNTHNIDLRTEFHEEANHVWADINMIEEVIVNYFTNAIDHTEGDRVIIIKLLRLNEMKIRFSIFNTGPTIPEDQLDFIWDKFYKIDKSRHREFGGTGIGLSIVKAIMKIHNNNYGVINHKDGVEFYADMDALPRQ